MVLSMLQQSKRRAAARTRSALERHKRAMRKPPAGSSKKAKQAWRKASRAREAEIHALEAQRASHLGLHLLEFFELYGCNFNYHRVGLSVRAGGTYFDKQQWGLKTVEDQRGGFGGGALLAALNPTVEQVLDVGKGAYAMPRIRMAFNHAYFTLARTLMAWGKHPQGIRDTCILTLRRGRRQRCRSWSPSLLASISHTTQNQTRRAAGLRGAGYIVDLSDAERARAPSNIINLQVKQSTWQVTKAMQIKRRLQAWQCTSGSIRTTPYPIASQSVIARHTRTLPGRSTTAGATTTNDDSNSEADFVIDEESSDDSGIDVNSSDDNSSEDSGRRRRRRQQQRRHRR